MTAEGLSPSICSVDNHMSGLSTFCRGSLNGLVKDSDFHGNADGMGDIRKEEPYKACAIIKVPLDQVKVIDHPDLQARRTDGFGKTWDHNLLGKIIKEEVTSHSIYTIITFDNYGVSGHSNHCDVHHGTCKFLHQISGGNIEARELISTNLIRKYCGPIDIWLSILSALQSPRE
ncbi:N-acetylglucosaminyl phosphatidylinositol deacetylase-related [Dillenia turbinata]|uniref:N-acetylglucosaminylphosphatidylinositol deacetylase n=1 Tax=Dillenia turbinata TaxID=194707 RepID=A0AAN8VRV0_9MAGN